MTSREIIKRVVEHNNPPRIGLFFKEGNPSDIVWTPTFELYHPERDRFSEWGRYPELLDQVGGFAGEVRLTPYGNIYGRLGGKTSGECLKGALTDGWALLDTYEFPKLRKLDTCVHTDQYKLTGFPYGVFSALRDTRLMANALADTLLEPENVSRYLDRFKAFSLQAVDIAIASGADAMIMYDDLGTQHSTFMSPDSFRTLFIPVYKALADRLHQNGLRFFLHSCGFIYPLMRDLIDAGIDVFQFDQPELAGSEKLAAEFGRQAAFMFPVDIQKIMPTGDRDVITKGAVQMVEAFKRQGGSLIAQDYGSWHDIGVEPEWQQWARDAVIAHMAM